MNFKINWTEQKLRDEIAVLDTRSKLFKILKEELTKRGYWRNLPRGNPANGYRISMQNKKDEV